MVCCCKSCFTYFTRGKAWLPLTIWPAPSLAHYCLNDCLLRHIKCLYCKTRECDVPFVNCRHAAPVFGMQGLALIQGSISAAIPIAQTGKENVVINLNNPL
jgi:hypothetical protein